MPLLHGFMAKVATILAKSLWDFSIGKSEGHGHLIIAVQETFHFHKTLKK